MDHLEGKDWRRKLAGARILIADNEDELADVLKESLELFGATVQLAANVEQATLAIHESGPWDVVVSDVRMPGGGGRELSRRVRASAVGTPMLFMSGFIDDEATSVAGELGQPLLAKPFKIRDLLDRVVEILDTKRSSAPLGS